MFQRFPVPATPAFCADIGERSVAVVVIQNVFAEVGDEQIIPAVVVVVADADALAPSGVRDAGFQRHVGESAVAIVFETDAKSVPARRESLPAACRSPEKYRASRRCRSRRKRRRNRWFRADICFCVRRRRWFWRSGRILRATLMKVTPRSLLAGALFRGFRFLRCRSFAANRAGRAMPACFPTKARAQIRLRRFQENAA